MKLGLIIKSTSAGEQEVFSINKGEEWAKFAADSRSIIKDLEGFDGSGKSVIVAKILGSLGYLIGVVKVRPEGSGRPNDNTTAWIHVPAKMNITGNELTSVIMYVGEQLAAPMGINPAILNELFTKEYANKDVKYPALAFIGGYNPEGSIGWRYYGIGTGYALHELLGNSLVQTSYKKYKCICFVDKSLNLSTIGGEIIKSDPKEPIKVEAPVDNNGFTAFIKTKNQEIPFTDAIEIPTNTPLMVIWKKEGYFDIEKELKGGNSSSLTIQENERKLIFKRSWIKITNQRFNHLSDAEISVNGKAFSSDITEITEAALRDGVKIRVSHQGYEPKEKVINQISSNIEIRLDDKQYSKEYTLRIEDGKNLESDAIITVKMSNRYTGMPLKGYRSDHDGYIVYENNLMTKIKWFAIGVASVFVFGLLWAGYEALDSWVDNHEFQLGWPPITEVKKQTTYSTTSKDTELESEKAIAAKDSLKEKACTYLSSNEIWHKDSLAMYDLTKDLFDNMNSFKIEDLIKLESSELKEVEQIKKLISAARQSKEDNIKPYIGKEDHDGKYNSATDLGINIDNYISWITEKHSAAQKKAKGDTSKQSKKKENTKSDSGKKEQSASDGTKKDNIRGGI